MIVFLLFVHILPDYEYFVYETNDKGKVGFIEVTSQKDSLGYHIVYTSDRIIEVILDTLDLGTLYLNKIINNRQDLKIVRDKRFNVHFRGRRISYRADGPVYDRHTLDFALRGFNYDSMFETTFRLHIPELMIVNATLKVIDEEILAGPLGEILCWKIRMVPRIFFMRRKVYFWIEKEYPHRFIKYSNASGENNILLIDEKEHSTHSE